MDAAPPKIFDRTLWRRRRDRSARRGDVDLFLYERTLDDVVDRLETATRSFDRALFWGAAGLAERLTPAAGVGRIVHADIAAGRIASPGLRVCADEEAAPFAPESFDLIVSMLTLHSANDLVGALAQMRRTLKPDGFFVASLFAENTLARLRQALYTAETRMLGGVSPRVAPFATVRDLGSALQRAGFAMPVADLDAVRVRYATPARLIDDLRAMGETNALMRRGGAMTRRTAEALFEELGASADPVEFDIVTLTGWAPAAGQPRPLRPGSAKVSLAHALKPGDD